MTLAPMFLASMASSTGTALMPELLTTTTTSPGRTSNETMMTLAYPSVRSTMPALSVPKLVRLMSSIALNAKRLPAR